MAVKAKAEITISDILDGTDGIDGYSIIPMNRAPTYNTAYEYAWWKKVSVSGYTEKWAAINYADFKIGDIAIFSGTILDRNNAGVQMLLRVIDVGMNGEHVIRGSSICLLESGEDVQAALSNMIIGSRNLVLGTDVPNVSPQTEELAVVNHNKAYKFSSLITSDPKKFLLDNKNLRLLLSYDIEVEEIYYDPSLTHNRCGVYFQFNFTNKEDGTVKYWYGTHTGPCHATYRHTGPSTNSLFWYTTPDVANKLVFHYSCYVTPDTDPIKSFYENPDKYDVTVSNCMTEIRGKTKGGKISNVSLTLSTIPMDWTPAPEDIQDQIDSAVTLLDDLVSDSKLTPNEKVLAQKEWLIIADEYSKYITQASGYGVSTTAYTNAYNALNSYLNTTNSGVIFNMNTTTDISSSIFTSSFKTYYNSKVDLINAITEAKAKYEAGAIQVGGRNLAEKTNQGATNWGWSMQTGDSTVAELIENGIRCCKFTRGSIEQSGWSVILYSDIGRNKLEAGGQYTISFEVKGSVSTRISAWFRSSNGQNELIDTRQINDNYIVENQWSKCTFVVTLKDTLPTATDQYLYLIDMNSGTGISYIFKNLKIEKGNKATDWTPAPEDVQEGIDNAQGTADKAEGDASNALNQVVDAKATLSLLQSSIETLVTDANGASMMTQTSTGWTFNMGGFESALDKATNDITAIYGDISAVTDIANAADQLAKDIANKTAYINMSTDEDGAPCIELGKTDNEFKLRITNTSIDFMQGSQKIAYITNQSLYIRSSVVTDEMQIGEGTGFIWKKRSNGNMGLRSIG